MTLILLIVSTVGVVSIFIYLIRVNFGLSSCFEITVSNFNVLVYRSRTRLRECLENKWLLKGIAHANLPTSNTINFRETG